MPLQRTPSKNEHVAPQIITRADGKKLFAREVRKATGLSTEEFIEKWESGKLPDNSDNVRLSMMIPLARYKSL